MGNKSTRNAPLSEPMSFVLGQDPDGRQLCLDVMVGVGDHLVPLPHISLTAFVLFSFNHEYQPSILGACW